MRVAELVYVSGSNPDAERHVSSILTSRTIPGWCNGSTIGFDPVGRGSNPLLGAMWFHSQEVKASDCKSDIARSNRAGTSNMQDDAGRLRHRSRKPWAKVMLWGSTPPSCATNAFLSPLVAGSNPTERANLRL